MPFWWPGSQEPMKERVCWLLAVINLSGFPPRQEAWPWPQNTSQMIPSRVTGTSKSTHAWNSNWVEVGECSKWEQGLPEVSIWA